jgi:hypothetical protein
MFLGFIFLTVNLWVLYCVGPYKGKERKRARAIALVLFRAVKRHEILPLLNAEAVFCEVTAFLYVNK